MISGIAHINLTIPPGTLDAAAAFYGATLGLTQRPVPQLQKGSLAWFDVGSSGQQVHIAFHRGADSTELATKSSRHACFRLESPEKLLELQRRIFAHLEAKSDGAPVQCDKPGEENSGKSMLQMPRPCGAGPTVANQRPRVVRLR
jgi:hypothetical protein